MAKERKNRKQERANEEQSQFIEKLIAVNRTAKVVKGGRRFSFSAVVVVGDGKGMIGRGLGKAGEVSDAIAKATEAAKKNLVKIPLQNGTIPHAITGRADAGKVFLKQAAPGTGVIAGSAVRAVLECAGVENVLSKSIGSSNPHNLVSATFDALTRLEDPLAVARRRGISLKKVFNG
ncbi:MAG: 30S ribosomal protein S5 [Bacteroidetes Order II. Incertae sedis bacterium]|nr:30S ribosomal protein S5 [Bacteroidetes Order II. bacterium]